MKHFAHPLAFAFALVSFAAVYLIPASTETRGHLITGNAKFYAQQLDELLRTAPNRAM